MSVIWTDPFETPTKAQKPAVTVDIDEGRYLQDIGCLECRTVVRATLTFAMPIRPYTVALCCDLCLKELVTFEQFTSVSAI